ncbi:MAG: Na+/H+ antiporter NhaA, partial [Clostridia bacterium]|nr:Na+/H+ antiporter NhaA [Clostridia bacterium]
MSNDIIRAYSIPLILGVLVALLVANVAPHWYEYWIEEHLFFGKFTFAWFVENIFMVFFFGTAGIEIVHALSPGGALNPIKKAVTPLMATLGGVLGPAGLFLLLNHFFGHPDWSNGWGICTATDIALAWLFAKLVFGKDHPAVSFLLLLAVADDAIGLAIIAIFYPTPGQPIRPLFLLLVLAGMLVSFAFKKLKVKSYWP